MKASKTVVGRCGGMDHNEGQQDSAWTMWRNGSQGRPARQWLDDVEEWITMKASKTVLGRCGGMDHKEGQQDSGWPMWRNGSQ